MKKGFTLLEMGIVIVIIGVLTITIGKLMPKIENVSLESDIKQELSRAKELIDQYIYTNKKLPSYSGSGRVYKMDSKTADLIGIDNNKFGYLTGGLDNNTNADPCTEQIGLLLIGSQGERLSESVTYVIYSLDPETLSSFYVTISQKYTFAVFDFSSGKPTLADFMNAKDLNYICKVRIKFKKYIPPIFTAGQRTYFSPDFLENAESDRYSYCFVVNDGSFPGVSTVSISENNSKQPINNNDEICSKDDPNNDPYKKIPMGIFSIGTQTNTFLVPANETKDTYTMKIYVRDDISKEKAIFTARALISR